MNKERNTRKKIPSLVSLWYRSYWAPCLQRNLQSFLAATIWRIIGCGNWLADWPIYMLSLDGRLIFSNPIGGTMAIMFAPIRKALTKNWVGLTGMWSILGQLWFYVGKCDFVLKMTKLSKEQSKTVIHLRAQGLSSSKIKKHFDSIGVNVTSRTIRNHYKERPQTLTRRPRKMFE